jgi:flagellar hook-associated protein 2
MKAERTRVDKFSQNKQLIEWRKDIYHNVNKDFSNFILDVTKELGLKTNTYGSMVKKPASQTWVKKGTSSNTGVAEVSARADAANGNYAVNVHKLASAWNSASNSSISTGDKANIATQFSINDGDTIDFTITTNKGSVTINKTNLSTVTLSDIASEINKANIGVTASYDANTDRFFLQTNDTGTNNTIKITDNSVLSDGMDFLTGNNSKLKLQYKDTMGVFQDIGDGAVYTGGNALLDVGAAVGIEQQSNQFSINGVNYNLKSIGSTTVSVSTDVDGILDKIRLFVEKYNDLVDKIGSKLSEERYRKYPPLTAEQKEAMSEKEIELWEEKAKSGLIQNDSSVKKAMQNVRSGLYEKVVDLDGNPITPNDELFDIGITTGNYKSKGKLEINEDRLRTAITNDPDSVLSLLFQESSITKADSLLTDAEKQQKRAESGLVNRMFDDIVVGMKEVINKSGTGNNTDLYRSVKSNILIDFVTNMGSTSMLDKDMSTLDKQIDREEARLIRLENHYWSKFTAMEKAIQEMNAQSSWMMQQMGSM